MTLDASKDSPTAIYIIVDEDGQPRYVGKTLNPKWRLPKHRNRPWYAEAYIVEWTTLGLSANRERHWILAMKGLGCDLANIKNGGGITMSFSPQARANMSAAQLGQKQSPETVAKRVAHLIGKPRPPDVIARIAAANQGLKRSPETRARISAAKAGRRQRPEVVALRAIANTGKTRSVETRQRMSDAQLARVINGQHKTGRERYITWAGRTQKITEWSKELGGQKSSLTARLSKGWSLERAMTTRFGIGRATAPK